MTPEHIISLIQDAFWTTFLISAPLLALTLFAGLIISILQAVTQIHEQTLTFIPKILAVVVSLLLFGPWMLNTLVGYASKIFLSLPGMVR
jgi:flagellar biosynthetic protein FliQ